MSARATAGVSQPKPKLTPAEAARLYRDEQWSVCQIALAHSRITVAGVAEYLSAEGITGGNRYCPIHRAYERHRS
jgi:hypothetical protein